MQVEQVRQSSLGSRLADTVQIHNVGMHLPLPPSQPIAAIKSNQVQQPKPQPQSISSAYRVYVYLMQLIASHTLIVEQRELTRQREKETEGEGEGEKRRRYKEKMLHSCIKLYCTKDSHRCCRGPSERTQFYFKCSH